ncbi:MAG: hypothetical protein ACI4JN_01460 [Ruminococcus sp.]
MKDVYIVLSQTGTALSRVLKLITGAEYNHASISLDSELCELYSFGRINPMNPVVGGFVKESRSAGTFKRFSNTKIIVLKRQVSDEVFLKMEKHLHKMYRNRHNFRYNYKGLFLAAAGIHSHKNRHFYCSEFVRYILLKFGMKEAECLDEIVKPMDFLKMQSWDVIYKGRMQVYSLPVPCIF